MFAADGLTQPAAVWQPAKGSAQEALMENFANIRSTLSWGFGQGHGYLKSALPPVMLKRQKDSTNIRSVGSGNPVGMFALIVL